MASIVTPSLTGLKRRTISSLASEWLNPRSTKELDIVIPVIRKDWPSLPHVIEAARRYIKHPIRSIQVIGSERPEPWGTYDLQGVVFRPDHEVVQIRRQEIQVRPNGWDRSGWLLQQFVKLSSDTFCTCEHILVLDADTVLLRPQRFVKDGKAVLNVSEEHHDPYYAAIRRLLPDIALAPHSFVCHHMLFRSSILKKLKAELARGGRSWVQAILDAIDRTEVSCFSEYELYGNFVMNRFPDQVRIEHFLNVSYSSSRIGTIRFVKTRHPLLKSASFHSR